MEYSVDDIDKPLELVVQVRLLTCGPTMTVFFHVYTYHTHVHTHTQNYNTHAHHSLLYFFPNRCKLRQSMAFLSGVIPWKYQLISLIQEVVYT